MSLKKRIMLNDEIIANQDSKKLKHNNNEDIFIKRGNRNKNFKFFNIITSLRESQFVKN